MPENLEELSDEMLANRLRDTARRLRDATAERDRLIQEAGRRRREGNETWTQVRVATLASISQQAVSLKWKDQSANSGDTTE
ncbi:hypothetical protein ACIBHX_02225 [Nonomuraea sp. NPDC050536]|uniref:hypothetical protein n=1 Tax=Nonomuraea sp. NPDC050536 TaxID=3364366 RepID=UPI0037C7B793